MGTHQAPSTTKNKKKREHISTKNHITNNIFSRAVGKFPREETSNHQ